MFMLISCKSFNLKGALHVSNDSSSASFREIAIFLKQFNMCSGKEIDCLFNVELDDFWIIPVDHDVYSLFREKGWLEGDSYVIKRECKLSCIDFLP